MTVTPEEAMRVLAPNGVLLLRHGNAATKTVKPWPTDIDEWTHYLHDAGNNAVAHDARIDEPRHLQWIDDPRWSRHHDHMSSSSAMVSAHGRNFYIFDDGSRSSILLPSHWKLLARDAFNGVILWEHEIPDWWNHLWALKSGPAQLPRRLVAVGDTVYVTLGINAPVTALDATTGETIRTYEQTKGTEEILCRDGILYLSVNDTPLNIQGIPSQADYEFKESPRRMMAIRADTGAVLWNRNCRWIAPLSLTVDADHVYFYNGENVLALHRDTGKNVWTNNIIGKRTSMPSNYGVAMVAYGDTLLFSGSDPDAKVSYDMNNANTLWAFDTATGQKLWSASNPHSGYRSAEDLLVMQGLVWSDDDFGFKATGVFTGRDPHTGEAKVTFPPDVDSYWFHHRCYRAKATDKYLLPSRTGIEFVNPATKHWEINDWIRGACLYGVMPANGMLYNMPNPCACYEESKIYGFHAVAAESATRQLPAVIAEDGRLLRGPAYGWLQTDVHTGAGDWPCYRHDPARSGMASTRAPAIPVERWSTMLGGKLSAVTVADGKLFVAQVNTHTLFALDAATGATRWSYMAGGRIDSPPTLANGRAYFGSADGWVYCLRASDGALIWRYRAAPRNDQRMAFGQLESAWPVPGSVLLRQDEVWAVAGRSAFVDGGMRLLRLNAVTGDKIAEILLNENIPGTDKNLQTLVKGLNMPVASNDILVDDGKFVYMHSQRFDAQGNRLDLANPTRNVTRQQTETTHLFCPTGFLDDAYWHRSYWVYGQRWASGCNGYYLVGRYAPCGRLLVFSRDNVYGYSRQPKFFRWTTPINRVLFGSKSAPAIVPFNPNNQNMTKVNWDWCANSPLQVRALVLAGDALIAAGPPDLLNEEPSLADYNNPNVQKALEDQDASVRGEHGALLQYSHVADGTPGIQLPLKEMPVWDGMVAANGQLYLATVNGSVTCLMEKP